MTRPMHAKCQDAISKRTDTERPICTRGERLFKPLPTKAVVPRWQYLRLQKLDYATCEIGKIDLALKVLGYGFV